MGIVVGLGLLAGTPAYAAQFDVVGSSRIQGSGDEALWGAAILSDGTVVVAGRLGDTTPSDAAAVPLGDASESAPGGLLHLSPDGTTVLGHYRIAEDIWDLAIDDGDRVYLAAGEAGVVAIDLDIETVAWSDGGYWAHRIDASPTGEVAVLQPDNLGDPDSAGGAGTIHVYDGDGASTAAFAGHRNTTDVCWADGRIVHLGWRQATAIGNPVQIAYARVVDPSGAAAWTAYDWSTDESADDYLNRPENNMADTRGYRCASVGGRVFLSFEAAGGNHIFRYAPDDVGEGVEIVGGDAYHEFYDTAAEHKTVLVVLDVETGAFVTAQQFLARLDSGGGNTVRQQRGGLAVDGSGRVYLTGASASGFPYSESLPGVSDYRGGAYFLAMSADLSERLYASRVTSGGEGHAVAIREFDGETNMVYVGQHSDGDSFHAKDEFPTGPGGGELDGFVAVWNGVTPVPGSDGGSGGSDSGGSPSEDSSTGGAGGSDSGGSGTAPAETSSQGTGGSPAAADSDDTGGCACRSQPRSSFGALWLLLPWIAYGRRAPRVRSARGR